MLGSTTRFSSATRVVEVALPSRVSLVGDHLALDFVNGRPSPLGARADWPRDGIELVHWLDAIGEADARRILDNLDIRAGLDEVAARARGLREWLRGFVGRHAGREVGEEVLVELHPLNDLLDRGTSYWQIGLGGGVEVMSDDGCLPRLRRMRRLTTPDQLLQPAAEAIADLISNEDFRLIHACEGKTCGRFFLDKTKRPARRWGDAMSCPDCSKKAVGRVRADPDSK